MIAPAHTNAFLMASEDEMERDLCVTPTTVLELIAALKKWTQLVGQNTKIFATINNHNSNISRPTITSTSLLPLEVVSGYLVDIHTVEVEIPGQYVTESLATGYQQGPQLQNMSSQYFDASVGDDCDLREPFTEQHERLQCFQPDMELIRRNMLLCRRVTMRSHSGKTYPFLVTSVPNSESTCYGRSEDRLWSLVTHLNRILDRNPNSRRRALRIHAPIILPLSQRIRLINEHVNSYESLENVFSDYCKSQMHIEPEQMLSEYWNIMKSLLEQNKEQYVMMEHDKAEAQMKLDIYSKLSEKIPNDILTKSMTQRARSSWNQLFQMRKRFTTQLGVFALLEHLFSVRNVGVEKILLSQDTGDLFRMDLRAEFDADTGRLRNDNKVPFRLSRNMEHFVSPFGMEGTLLNTMSVAAHALNKNRTHVRSLLQLFVRDELIAWQSIYCGSISDKFSMDEQLLKSTVNANVEDDILQKLDDLAPSTVTLLPSTSGLLVPGTPIIRMYSNNGPIQQPVAPTANGTDVVMNGTAPQPQVAPTLPTNEQVLNAKISELIYAAKQVDNLSQMAPSMFVWF
jgi:phosphatidylinositol kinase/protein kinase (PI-3  family)